MPEVKSGAPKPMHFRELVSIIVPIFETESFLEECLQSICRQTYSNLEIICVNGRSMDNSATIVKNFMLRDQRIKLINQEIDNGLGGSRNEGLKYASGTYIQFVDGDDRISPTMVEELVGALEETGADYSFCALSSFINGSPLPAKPEEPFHSESSRLLARRGPIDLSANPDVLVDIYPSAWIALRRRSQISQLQASFPENRLAEDHFFHYTMGFNSNSAIYLPRHLYEYRRSADQLSSDSSERSYGVFETIAENEHIFEKYIPSDALYGSTIRMSIRLLFEKIGSLRSNRAISEVFFRRSAELLGKFPRADLELFKDPAVSIKDLDILLGEIPPGYSEEPDSSVGVLRAKTHTASILSGEPIPLTNNERRQLTLPIPDWSTKAKSPWADVEVHFDQPIDLNGRLIRSIVAVNGPAEISLRFALFCQPKSGRNDQEEHAGDDHILEFRRSFRAGTNILYFGSWNCSVLRGKPDPAKVRKILFGGPAEDSIFGATLTVLDGAVPIDLLEVSAELSDSLEA